MFVRYLRNAILLLSVLWGIAIYREHQGKATPVKDSAEKLIKEEWQAHNEAEHKNELFKKPLFKKKRSLFSESEKERFPF